MPAQPHAAAKSSGLHALPPSWRRNAKRSSSPSCVAQAARSSRGDPCGAQAGVGKDSTTRPAESRRRKTSPPAEVTSNSSPPALKARWTPEAPPVAGTWTSPTGCQTPPLEWKMPAAVGKCLNISAIRAPSTTVSGCSAIAAASNSASFGTGSLANSSWAPPQVQVSVEASGAWLPHRSNSPREVTNSSPRLVHDAPATGADLSRPSSAKGAARTAAPLLWPGTAAPKPRRVKATMRSPCAAEGAQRRWLGSNIAGQAMSWTLGAGAMKLGGNSAGPAREVTASPEDARAAALAASSLSIGKASKRSWMAASWPFDKRRWWPAGAAACASAACSSASGAECPPSAACASAGAAWASAVWASPAMASPSWASVAWASTAWASPLWASPPWPAAGLA
mmetsp:Transcript_19000/g.55105  ORF Transcript_19000/g.55105 Transcript_19000/m.55105 type:complete len:395 (+) Transcript_19000:156-1340(+)